MIAEFSLSEGNPVTVRIPTEVGRRPDAKWATVPVASGPGRRRQLGDLLGSATAAEALSCEHGRRG